MKKIIALIVIAIMCATMPIAAIAAGTGTNYTDPKSNAQFIVPENWEQKPLSKERKTIDVKFCSTTDQGMSILFGCADLWNQMSASDRSGLTRGDIDNSLFSKEYIASSMGVKATDVLKKTYSGKEYYVLEIITKNSSYGIEMSIAMTTAIHVENGFMYMFQFSGNKNHKLYKDFESVLSSVKYPGEVTSENTTDNTKSNNKDSQDSIPENTKSNSKDSQDSTPENIIISLLVTIVVYSLPIIIYRYGVKKAPVEPQQAKKITIIYAFFAFVVMSIILFASNESGTRGGAIILWSWINYKMLTSGKKADAGEQNNAVPSAADEKHIIGTGESKSTHSHDLAQKQAGIEDTVESSPKTRALYNAVLDNGLSAAKNEKELKEYAARKKAQLRELPERQETITKVPTANQQMDKAMFCRKCGTKIAPDAAFCPECGTKVFIPATTETTETTETSDNILLAEKYTPMPATESIKGASSKMSLAYSTKDLSPTLRRAFILVEDGEWEKADIYFERVLDEEPENAYAYLGKLLVEYHVDSTEQLRNAPDISSNKLYRRAVQYSDADLKKELQRL